MLFDFLAGLIFYVSAYLLVVASALALGVGSAAAWLMRAVATLEITLLVASLVVGLSYVREIFTACYSANVYERVVFANRATSVFRWSYGIMLVSAFLPQLLWFRRFRRPLPALLISLGSVLPSALERAVSLASSWRSSM
jgi:molybdopterin-containing oxidoreductase family membrane subunit